MNALIDISAIILLAVIYVAAVYFAVAALAPALAYPAGLLAAMVAVLVYILLVILRHEERGLPVALLFLMPIVCVAAGVLWWLLRLLGLWEPIR